jgi:hypothetical protein
LGVGFFGMGSLLFLKSSISNSLLFSILPDSDAADLQIGAAVIRN